METEYRTGWVSVLTQSGTAYNSAQGEESYHILAEQTLWPYKKCRGVGVPPNDPEVQLCPGQMHIETDLLAARRVLHRRDGQEGNSLLGFPIWELDSGRLAAGDVSLT